LSRKAVRAEEELTGVASCGRAVTESPDELKQLRVGAAFGGDRADIACSKSHSDLKKACNERVGSLLKGPALHIAEPVEPEPHAGVELGDMKRWQRVDATSLLPRVDESEKGP